MRERDRILEKIDLAERWATRAEEYRPDTVEAYLDDDLTRAALERALQVSIEALVDTAGLFVSGLRLGLPASEDSLVEQIEGEILSRDQARLLDEMRGFRNVLVHQYGDLDDERVFDLARDFPADARRLTAAFRKSLEEHADRTG